MCPIVTVQVGDHYIPATPFFIPSGPKSATDMPVSAVMAAQKLPPDEFYFFTERRFIDCVEFDFPWACVVRMRDGLCSTSEEKLHARGLGSVFGQIKSVVFGALKDKSICRVLIRGIPTAPHGLPCPL